MSARQRGRKIEQGRVKRRAKKSKAEKTVTARKKVTGQKKVTAPKKTRTKAPRASAPMRKAVPASAPPLDVWEAGERLPAAGLQAPPVGVIEVTTVEILAVQEPSTTP